MKRKVNEVSRLTGVSKRTLQYYDDEGLLSVERSKDNHRLYDDAALERVWQILIYKEMEFKLEEIKQILELTENEREKYLEQKLEKIRKEMQRLEEQKYFISMMGRYGIPPVPVEGDESGKSYVEWIMELKKDLNKSI